MSSDFLIITALEQETDALVSKLAARKLVPSHEDVRVCRKTLAQLARSLSRFRKTRARLSRLLRRSKAANPVPRTAPELLGDSPVISLSVAKAVRDSPISLAVTRR